MKVVCHIPVQANINAIVLRVFGQRDRQPIGRDDRTARRPQRCNPFNVRLDFAHPLRINDFQSRRTISLALFIDTFQPRQVILVKRDCQLTYTLDLHLQVAA